jgi:hypothetical protein
VNRSFRVLHALGALVAGAIMLEGCGSRTTPLLAPLSGWNMSNRASASSDAVSGNRWAIGVRGSGLALGHARPARSPAFKETGTTLNGTAGLLYISEEQGSSATYVAVFRGKLRRPIRTISSGLAGADGEWVDKSRNLYVANWQGPTVQEYTPGGASPAFTYSAGLVNPVNVTTDAAGNVYVVDYPGYVVEYPHRINVPIRTYSINGSAEGATFTRNGDLFVDYVVPSTRKSRIEKFPKGSQSGENVGPWFDWLGGIVVDQRDNLVVCNQTLGEIEVLSAPYKKVVRRIRHFTTPFHLTFNASGKSLYVADPATQLVDVVEYSSGRILKQLGPTNGLYLPLGVAASPELQ